MTRVQGYLYRLGGRVLLVQVFGILNMADSRLYKISQEGTQEIVDGVTFNTTNARRDED